MRRITIAASSSDERGHAARARVADADPVVRQQRARQPPERRPGQRQRLVARGEGASAHPALEARVDVVPGVAVGVAHDLERRTRVEADESARYHGEPGLLADLADHGVTQRFTDLDGPARQPPLPAVGALLEQEASPPIEDHRRDARPDTDDPGQIRLERDHPPNLLDAHRQRNTIAKDCDHAALNRVLNFSQGIGATAATAAFSSTWAVDFMPTSAVPMPGVERENWSERWASVVSPGRCSTITGGRLRVSWPWYTEADAITYTSSRLAASSVDTVSFPIRWLARVNASVMARL